MKPIRIFISSPGDVAEERQKARQVVEKLQHFYGSRVTLIPVLWEDLPLGADASFQQGIDLLLAEKHHIDIAVFILWSRLGSPLGPPPKPDGTPYRSGTEREFEIMMEARRRSGGKRPHILAYTRIDDEGFNPILDAKEPDDVLAKLIGQRKLARAFIRETFQDDQGRNLRAYHTYNEPASFGRQLWIHLQALINETLGGAWEGVRVLEGSPYRGLERFNVEHAQIFFGREPEACEVELLLRERANAGSAFVVILGASGLGKSSLAQAGVAAGLVQGNLDEAIKSWRLAIVQPAAAKGDLFEALARALAEPQAIPELREGGGALEKFGQTLSKDPAAALALKFDDAIFRAARASDGSVKLLLVVDQLEELWTDKRITPESRDAFLSALAAFSSGGNTWVLATLRSDLYPLALQCDAFVRLKRPLRDGARDGVFELSAPDAASIHRLIKEPAALAGLRFAVNKETGRSLDQDLLRDATGHPEGLPLLEYALEQLFEQRTAEGELTFEAYKKLGGLEGAIGTRAEQTFEALPADARNALAEILPLLVAVDLVSDQKTVRRQAPLAELTATPARRMLTESLIAARFLTTGEQDGAAIATLAHEALLRRWDPLRVWLAENRELLQLREHVHAAAADWSREEKNGQGSRDDLLLTSGLPLSRGERALQAGVLDEAESEFVRRSKAMAMAADLKKRRQLQWIALVSTIMTLVLALTAWHATKKTREVKQLLAESDAERAERLFTEDNAAAGVWYLSRAVMSGSASNHALERLWFSVTQRSWPQPVIKPVAHDTEVMAITFDPSGNRFATATKGGVVRIFSSADGKSLGQPLLHPKAVRGVLFSPDGRKLLTACDDGLARLWDVHGPVTSVAGISKHENVVVGIAWSSDGKSYVTGSQDNHLRVWSVAHPETPFFTKDMQANVHTVAFDPRNSARVLGVAKGKVRVWDTTTGAEVLHYDSVSDLNGACFSPDGGKVMSFSQDGDVRISALDAGIQQWAELTVGDTCHEARFSPDGKEFVVNLGTTVRSFSLTQPPVELWQHPFPDIVTAIKYTTEGKRIITACGNGRIEVFDSENGRSLSEPILGQGKPLSLDFHPLRNRVLCARSTRAVDIWALAAPQPLPLAAFHLGSPPLTLDARHGFACIAENGKGIILTPPPSGGGRFQGRYFDTGSPLIAAVIDPSRNAAVAGTGDGHLLKVDLNEHAAPQEIAKLTGAVSRIAFSLKGDLLAAGADDGRVGLWKWPEAISIPTQQRRANGVSELAFLEPGSTLVSASWNREIAFVAPQPNAIPSSRWNVQDDPQVIAASADQRVAVAVLKNGDVWLLGKPSPPAQPAFSMRASPSGAALTQDGRLVAIGTVTGIISIWNTQTQTRIAEISSGGASVSSLCFSADDRWLASGTEDGRAQIWESESGRPVTDALRRQSAVRNVSFSPDNRYLVSADLRGTILIWPVAPPNVAAKVTELARQCYQANQRFIPTADILPATESARLSDFIDSMRHTGNPAMQDDIELLNSYLPVQSAGAPPR